MPLWDLDDPEDEIEPGGDFEDGKESELICPDCAGEVRLVVRTNKKSGNQFLGCPNWPDCNYTRGIPEAWRMERAGQPKLL
jgi:ssDNA-binding Zn-finger/Zn-ribbon topoisomerase 1